MRFLDGFAAIAGEYDGFIVDLWGVIHDGVAPIAGAPECLARLAAAGKPVALLSNAPRRAAAAGRQLERMGVPADHYSFIMTSGEASFRLLRDRPDDWSRGLGERMFYIGPDRDLALVEGLGLTRVDDPAAASFVLNTGPDYLRPPAEAERFDPVLLACAAAGLKMICSNPDLEVIVGGERVLCAGMLALRYQAMGGEARMLGKPEPEIYGTVLAGLGLARARVLAVGDALRTDIAGAAGAGVDSCWVLGGLHGAHLSTEADVAAEAGRAGLAPVAAIGRLVW